MIALSHIQKTGGTTLVGILRRNYGIFHADVEPVAPTGHYYETVYSARDHRIVKRVLPPLKSIASHRIKPYSDLIEAEPSVRYVTWVREPIGRVVSHFQYGVKRQFTDGDFEEWASRWGMHNMMCRHLGKTGRFDEAASVLVDTQTLVGFMENFNESLVLLREWVGHPGFDVSIAQRNVASDRSVGKAVMDDPQAVALLRELNQEDIKLYAWLRDQYWPEQVNQYGAQRLRKDVGELVEYPASTRSARESSNRVLRNVWFKPAHRTLSAVQQRRTGR